MIGVAPQGFRGTVATGPASPLYLPLAMHSRVLSGPAQRLCYERRFRLFNVFARLKPGVTELQALAALQTIAARLEVACPKTTKGRTLEKAIPAVTAALASLNPDPALLNPGSVQKVIDQALWIPGMAAMLFGGLGLPGLLLAVSGVYGVMAHAVARRTTETGLRMAIGAGPAHVVRMVILQTATIAAIGIAAGLLATLLLTRRLHNLLYNIVPPDPATLSTVAATLALTALTAALLPAWRASRIDPVPALRGE